MELKFEAEKTFLLSIGDIVEHLHFHLIPKHKNKCSMGDYCFQKPFESEGERKPTESDKIRLAEDIKTIMQTLVPK